MNRIDLYQILFGKNHIKDGSVIEWAEHGRAGGISTGTSFKGVQEIPLKTILDETDGSAIYIGEANHKAKTSELVWRILKIVKVGAVTTIFYADGTDGFDKEWDERVGYDYS